MPRTISILGCGWVGLPLGRALADGGHRVNGATTTPSKRPALEEAGVAPYVLRLAPGFDDRERAADFFAGADVLVFTVPPPRDVDDRIAFYKKQMRAALDAARAGESSVQHVLYTSSTGVYPPRGRAMTESDAASTDAEIAALKRESSRAVLAAERMLAEQASGANFNHTVVRLAGLYGPGRDPGRFLAGRTDLSEGRRPINFVHQDDAVGVLRAVIEQNAWNTVFNACADAHPTRRDFFQQKAEAAGLEPPTFSDNEKGAFKVVSNAKVKEQLGYEFRHPDPLA
jgi:nucleoside-diphosphate-sugar epimerase